MRRARRMPLATAAALSMVLAFTSVAGGAANRRFVQILDNCDPATFNAALWPDACVRPGGGLTFERFIGQMLSKGRVDSWRFAPGRVRLAEGGTIVAVNRGGEFHTFTPVEQFGGGCVDEINALLGLTPVAECADPSLFGTTGVPPGGRLQTAPLAEGTQRFMCLIHPWQRTTANVR